MKIKKILRVAISLLVLISIVSQVETQTGTERVWKTPPSVYITEMKADKSYTDPKGIIQLESNVRRLSFSYHAISSQTRPGGIKYVYQLVGYDKDLRGPTDQETVEYFDLESREYTFRVQAVDRDLNYSETASVLVVIPPLPFYQKTVFSVVLSVIGVVLLSGVIVLARQRWRLARAERQRLQQELEDARQMQLRLLPKTAPIIEGFELAGFSKPAREVGGDFFDYLLLRDGTIGFALADVSGKGLKGAMNAVLTNGMLNAVAKHILERSEGIEASCGKILSALNADLYPRMGKRMFTALGLSILDRNNAVLHWANAAQPFPIVKRADQVFELQSEGGVPLGMMPNVTYQPQEFELQSDDIVVFYTDGISEAVNEAEEMYEVDRLKKIMTQIKPTMNAEKIIEAILHDVANFVGSAEQYDDMTVVVVKKVKRKT